MAALLTYLSESVGSVDGPTVAELARAINGQHGEDGEEGEDGDDGDDDDAEDGEGPPEGVTPGGPPDGSGPPRSWWTPVTTRNEASPLARPIRWAGEKGVAVRQNQPKDVAHCG